MRTTQRGFTLVEILVATAIFAIFMVGMLNLLDTSTKVTQLETSLADTQENVRFATYHIMRTARMMGGAEMPFASNVGGGDRWIAGSLKSNASGTVSIEGFGNVTVLPGSDVLTLRGFFEISPFFTDPTTALSSSDTVVVREYNKSGDAINDFGAFSKDQLEGRGVVFMGEGQYCVGEIGSGSDFSGSGTLRQLELKRMPGDQVWNALNTTASYPPSFKVFRVGVLDSYTFFVDPNNVLRRVRLSGGTVNPEPVAINIGGLQVALGVDDNGNGIVDDTEWLATPSGPAELVAKEVLKMRVTVLGRTEITVPDWVEPEATFEIEDGEVGSADRSAKWRRMQFRANLRNFSL